MVQRGAEEKMIINCLVCGDKLHRSSQHGKGSSPKRRIGKNQVTCGGSCGKRYDRIKRHLAGIKRNTILKHSQRAGGKK